MIREVSLSNEQWCRDWQLYKVLRLSEGWGLSPKHDSSSLRLKNILKEEYSGLLFIVVIKHWPKKKKKLLKERVYFTLQVIVHHWSKSEQELKPETGGKNWSKNNEEYCLLACFSCLLSLLSHINPEPPAQRVAPPTTRLNIPNAPQMCTYQSDGGNPSIKVPSQLHLSCVKVTKTNQQEEIERM